MQESTGWALASIGIVSLLSFIGIMLIKIRPGSKVVSIIVSLSVGTLLGDAFFHLIPETAATFAGDHRAIGLYTLSGFIFFMFLEHLLHWHHEHNEHGHEIHPVGYMTLFTGVVHNFMDGAIIAAAYAIAIPLGVATTIAVIFHEIPHELGNFGILIHAGFTKPKALLLNFCSALTAFLGGIMVINVGNYCTHFSAAVGGMTAGGFVYIAGTDLIPELKKEKNTLQRGVLFLVILIGMLCMFSLTFLER